MELESEFLLEFLTNNLLFNLVTFFSVDLCILLEVAILYVAHSVPTTAKVANIFFCSIDFSP